MAKESFYGFQRLKAQHPRRKKKIGTKKEITLNQRGELCNILLVLLKLTIVLIDKRIILIFYFIRHQNYFVFIQHKFRETLKKFSQFHMDIM